ncbi:hypothetical protein CC2G_007081 [Coprinopsis cinerea AmutBmut pab1-1]|nr:hypothetical protein CC2G_007081 [Coprinopsis cinerea AmutBmut pab1-1]
MYTMYAANNHGDVLPMDVDELPQPTSSFNGAIAIKSLGGYPYPLSDVGNFDNYLDHFLFSPEPCRRPSATPAEASVARRHDIVIRRAPYTVCQASGAEAVARTLAKLHQLDSALAQLRPTNDDKQGLRRLLWEARRKIKVTEDAYPDLLDVEPRWYSGLSLGELELYKEAFVIDAEARRDKDSHRPHFPSLLNPVREAAPPLSWHYLGDPYPACKDWIMQRPLASIRPRSRSYVVLLFEMGSSDSMTIFFRVCNGQRRDFVLDSKHCLECRRDSLRKSLLVWKHRQSLPEPSQVTGPVYLTPPTSLLSLPAASTTGDDGNYTSGFIDMDDMTDSATPTLRIINYSDDEEDEDEDMDLEPIQEELTRFRDPRPSVDSEKLLESGFPYDLKGSTPDAPLLRDLAEFSDESDDDLMDCDMVTMVDSDEIMLIEDEDEFY